MTEHTIQDAAHRFYTEVETALTLFKVLERTDSLEKNSAAIERVITHINQMLVSIIEEESKRRD